MDEERGARETRKVPRRHPRVRLVTQVEATSLGRTENISEGGMLVVTRDTFEPGTEVKFRFSLPGGRSIEGYGKVIHSKSKTQMGIEFGDLKQEDRKAIATFVREAAEEEGSADDTSEESNPA